MAKLVPHKQRKERKRPYMPWQVDDYDARADYQFFIPYQTLLLCRLADVTPLRLIIDFLEIINCAHYKQKDHSPARAILAEYFIAMGYGREYFSQDDTRQIFAEMDAVGALFPWAASSELLDAYCEWRDLHYDEWFLKWFNKGQRSVLQTPGL